MEANQLNWSGIITIGLVVALAGGVLGFAIGVWQSVNVRNDLILIEEADRIRQEAVAAEIERLQEIDSRVEYYRGVYDACVGFSLSIFSAPIEEAQMYCATELIPRAFEQGSYEVPSEGFIPP